MLARTAAKTLSRQHSRHDIRVVSRQTPQPMGVGADALPHPRLPFAIVNSVSVIVYKSLGVSNADIAFYTAWLYLPWVIKPLWSPVVDILRTRRWWIWTMQLLMGAGFAGVGLTLPLPMFFQASLT
jgi:hypothetical protein